MTFSTVLAGSIFPIQLEAERERMEGRLQREGVTTWSCKETQRRVNMGPTMRLPGSTVAPKDSWPGSQSQTSSLVYCSDIMASCTETSEESEEIWS